MHVLGIAHTFTRVWVSTLLFYSEQMWVNADHSRLGVFGRSKSDRPTPSSIWRRSSMFLASFAIGERVARVASPASTSRVAADPPGRFLITANAASRSAVSPSPRCRRDSLYLWIWHVTVSHGSILCTVGQLTIRVRYESTHTRRPACERRQCIFVWVGRLWACVFVVCLGSAGWTGWHCEVCPGNSGVSTREDDRATVRHGIPWTTEREERRWPKGPL